MLPLALPDAPGGLELLCLGAHADDLEIGCGGTVLRLLAERRVARVTWVVLSGNPARAGEAREGARRVLGDHGGARVVLLEFKDGFFPYVGGAVKEFFERLKGEVRPDLVLTHQRDDRHQDHRLVSELTWNTFRDHLVLEYEIMKVDGDLSQPNVYVALDEDTVRHKLRILAEVFGSQRDKRWFSEDVFRGLMRLRGVEGASRSGFAEAFHGRKLSM